MNKTWRQKKILVTGGSGFIGSNAVHFFHKLGADITVAVSPQVSKSKLASNLGDIVSKVRIVKIDLRNRNDVNKLTKGQDVILHFAAVDGNSTFKKNHSAEILSKNTTINLNLLESAVTNNVQQILFMSSADLYTSKAITITEESPIDISLRHMVDGYKLSKWFSELAVNDFYTQYKLHSIIVRASNIYGPRDEFMNLERMRFIPAVIQNLFTGTPITLWGNGKQERSFLYVDDFLKICSILLEKNIHNVPINLASKTTVTLQETIEMVSKLANKKVKIIIDVDKSSGAFSRKFNLARSKSHVGAFKETPLEEGLKKTLQFYKKFYLHNK